MSKALFFNALPDATSPTGYDRNYNADDLSDFLSIVCDTGVVKTNTVSAEAQGLKVVAASGLNINVNAGKAVIKGKGFINDALASLAISANGTATSRYDYVVIPNTVKTIGDNAFDQCVLLTSVDIPDSVTSIGNYAFNYCNALTDVNYTGSEEEWKAITIGSNNDYNYYKSNNRYFNQ